MSTHELTTNWLVPNLIAEHTVNLIAGTSRVGKTSLALGMLNQYMAGEGMLDYPASSTVSARRLGAIVLDRQISYTRILLTALEFEHLTTPRTFPLTSPSPESLQRAKEFSKDTNEPTTLAMLMALQESLVGPPQLLLIESIDGLLPSGPINQHLVRKFLFDCQTFCERFDCTIIGTCGAVKQKSGENYTSPIDMISGHSSWGSGVATAIVIANPDSLGHVSSPSRRIFISAPTTEDRYVYGRFEHRGRLELVDRVVADTVHETGAKLSMRLEKEQPGAEFQRDLFLDWGRELAISQRSVERWISDAIRLGELEKFGRTVNARYKKPNPS